MFKFRLFMNLKGISSAFVPRFIFQKNLDKIFNEILKYKDFELEHIATRVNYYNKIKSHFSIENNKVNKIGKLPFKNTSYAYDAYEISKYFKDSFLWNKKFSDVNYIFSNPTICKSRPIKESSNNILLNLDKNRHFVFIKDPLKFKEKKDIAIYRGAVYQEHRKKFFESYFNENFCDIGDTGKHDSLYKKNFLSKKEQSKYKFIISLEGNDVATNLKWAMSSNSLVLSTKMTCETWFMEGKLKANEHFVLINNENLLDTINYFIQHPKQAIEIINNAHNFINQFLNRKKEFHISILVLAKYFYYSDQLKINQKEILQIFQ
ncbi:glycosyl transferase family 90 [Campylobacter molothri]|uniref:glycosyl transferase family 90 n=1 Tax=Campylobacter molothri TaxID=1032242 RepID=UPI00301BFDE2|nr:lipopolysaccharide biosynthesis protein [Campylobacter sp. RM10542]